MGGGEGEGRKGKEILMFRGRRTFGMEAGWKFDCLQNGNFSKGLPGCGFIRCVLLIWCVILFMWF